MNKEELLYQITTLQQENKELKEELEEEKRINVEDLKTIDRQQEIIQELKDNWNKLNDYLNSYIKSIIKELKGDSNE